MDHIYIYNLFLVQMVFFVFMPALVCGSLAKTITLRSMSMLWFMPLNVLLTYIIGTALGMLLIKIAKVPHHLQGLVLGCCAAGNLGSLPLIIIPSMCKERGNHFGDVVVCHKHALAYASLSMALGAIFVWFYGYNIVRVYSSKISNVVKDSDSTENPLSGTETDPENLSKCYIGALVSAEENSQTNDQVKQLERECTMPYEQAKIVGLIIGVVPKFRKLLVDDNAPLRVVHDSVVMLGDAGIPTITLLVGANLLTGLKGLGKQLPLIIGITVVRFIALPAIGICIVRGAVHFGFIHPDPLYQFLLLLQFAVPPAIAMSTITQLFGAGEGECSVIMLATYSCAAVSLTLWSTLFMWLVI
ncbi:putative membrane transport protein [Lupinus albus]|uniref:Putative membrane transport protein n=1 Tax=Lupinus albus TaxID=3870 RepID=A0A6A4PV64_LUPAL|nr:putative membrane transport protein [Lupinus albus]